MGFLAGWLQTMQQALFEPSKLFRSARLDRGSAQLGFALLTASVFWGLGQLLEGFLFSGQKDQLREQTHRLLDTLGDRFSPLLRKMLESSQQASSPGWTIGLALFTPVLALLLLYLNAAVTHGFALVLGQSKRGFPATFAACAYACAPLVLMAIPGCGSFIATLWLIVLTSIGLKETHRMSTGGATASVLGPYAVFCCLILGATLVLVMSVKQSLGQP